MATIRKLIERRATLTYLLLTFLLSWGCMLLLLGPGEFPISPERSDEVLLFLYLAMLTGPAVSGLLLTGIVDGRAGYRELFSRLVPRRARLRWYAAALFGLPALNTLLLLALSRISPEYLPAIVTSGDRISLLLTSLTAALFVGILEEVGWTGFAIPRLLRRHGVFATGLMIGLLWGAWHFPLFWERESFTGAFPFGILLLSLFAWLPPYRVLMTWMYRRTGSLCVIIFAHAGLVMSTLAITPPSLGGIPLLDWLICWGTVLWVVAGATAILDEGRFMRASTEAEEGGAQIDSQTGPPGGLPRRAWQHVLLLCLLGYEALGALAGGVLLVAAPDGRLMDMSVHIMHGFFPDFLIPGLILGGMGILNTAAFLSVLRRSRNDWIFASLAMGGLAVWFLVEIAVIRQLHWLHAMWGLPVLAGCLLALSLSLRRRWERGSGGRNHD